MITFIYIMVVVALVAALLNTWLTGDWENLMGAGWTPWSGRGFP